MQIKRGLTLGKFAPLHRGHQFVIETALREMDELIVVVYDSPEVTRVPLPVRANWIRDLYPQVKVIEGWGGSNVTGDTPEIKKLQEDFIIETLGIHGITHFYCSEFYGEHMSEALGAVNRLVDEAREAVPISATKIREDTFAHREYLHPRVYRDLVLNIVFLGAPSTGKTTLCERLAHEYSTVWMPEYGREYWEAHQSNRRLSTEQLEEIATEHLRREEEMLLQSNKILFTDTNAMTTYMFSLDYHGSATPRLTDLAQQAAMRYDLVFLCEDDIPYDDTWDRSGEVHRAIFQKRIIADLIMRQIPFIRLCGDLETRVAKAKKVLGSFEKYQNVLDVFEL